MSTNWVEDIAVMHKKYGVHEWVSTASPYNLKKFIDFRLDFIEEEFEETQDAHFKEDAEEIVDGLIDLCVVAIGTLDALGVDPYKAWDNVLAANMAKEVGIKPERPNPLGLPDLIKPADWKAPSHADNHGVISHSFQEAIKQAMEVANKARTDILADNPDINSNWSPDAVHYNEQVSIDLVDFTKDSEYIRMMGDINDNSQK
jgi:predicted HAD superfamily Cof-like phosphohydrolase